MNFIDCIQTHVDSGNISQQKATALQKEYEALVAKYTDTMGSLEAASVAAKRTIDAKAKKVVDIKFSNLKAAKAMIDTRNTIKQELKEALKEYDGLSKTKKVLLGGQKPTFNDKVRDKLDHMASRQEAVRNLLFQEISDIIKKRGSMWQSEEFSVLMREAVEDLLGKPSGNPIARDMSKALKKAFDASNKMYNSHGGMIGRIANYFPQSHSASRFNTIVKKYGVSSDPAAIDAGFREWYEYILPRLDLDKMINESTGLPFTPEQLRKTMREDFENILTDGGAELAKRAEEGKVLPGKGGDLNVRRDKSRFYHFKDADAFLEYNDKFGLGNDNLFDVAVGHLGVMARDIGTMSMFGPKPDSTFANLAMMGASDSMQSKAFTQATYDAITGKLSASGDEKTWYRLYAAGRNQLRGAYLGGAFISAIGDPYWGRLASVRFGLPGFDTIKNLPKIVADGGVNDESMKFAMTQTDLILGASINRFDEATDIGARAMSGYEKFAHYSAEAVHRAGGLNRWTNFQELSGTLSVMHQAFQESGKKFGDLEPNYRKMLEAHGIDGKLWNIIRSTDPHVHAKRDAKFMTPQKIMERTDLPYDDRLQASIAYAGYIQEFRDMVVNKPTARVRGIQTGGFQSGTVARAAMQSIGMFKGFGFTVMLNHIVPKYVGLVKDPSLSNIMGMMGFAMATTMIGAASLQLKEIIKGNTPRDMDDSSFWRAAAAQGGGWGILGDFAFADYDRFGRTPMEQLPGPMFGIAGDVLKVGMGSFNKALEDNDYNALNKFMFDAYDLVAGTVPGNNLWYIRNHMEALFDTFPKAFDPEYYDKRERKMRYREKNFGNESYWVPGEWAPNMGVLFR